MSSSKHPYRWWDYFVFDPPMHTLYNPTWETLGSVFPGQDVGVFVPEGPAATYAAHGFLRVFAHRAMAPAAYTSFLKWNLVRLAHTPPILIRVANPHEGTGRVGTREALSSLINSAHITGMLQYVWDTAVNDRTGTWLFSPMRHATSSERIANYKRGSPDPAVLIVPAGKRGPIIHEAV